MGRQDAKKAQFGGLNNGIGKVTHPYTLKVHT